MIYDHDIKFTEGEFDFTRNQKDQMMKWLMYDQNISKDPGVYGSCKKVINRANQGSTFIVAESTMNRLIDHRPPEDTLREAISHKLCSLGKYESLDHNFFVYGDGPITVGYEDTGFMVDWENDNTIIHPQTFFKFQLPEERYGIFGEKVSFNGVSGRSLFFYRLTQACQAIYDTAPQEVKDIYDFGW